MREPAEFPIRPEEYPTVDELSRVVDTDPDLRDDIFCGALLGIGVIAVNPTQLIFEGTNEL